MKRIQKVVCAIALMGGALVWQGCDFQAAQDAFDSLDVIITVPEVNSRVAGVLVDANAGVPVNTVTTITFGGRDAGLIVDDFDDPVSEVQAESGVFTFGISNNFTPTTDNPAEFTVTVSIDGFNASTRTVQVFEEGLTTFQVLLVSDDPRQAPQGASGDSQSSGQASNGVTASDVTVTPPPATNSDTGDQISTSVTIPAGTVLQTADGTPLTGSLTTDIVNYTNSSDALLSLPESVTTDANGNPIPIEGVVSIGIRDANGNFATSVTGSSGKWSGGRLVASQGACTGSGITIVRSTSRPNGSPIDANIEFHRPGAATISLPSSSVVRDGADGNYEIIFCIPDDIELLPGGRTFIGIGGFTAGLFGACTASGTASVNLNGFTAGQVYNGTATLRGDGMAKTASVTLQNGSNTIDLSAFGQILDSSNLTLEVDVNGVKGSATGTFCSGGQTISMTNTRTAATLTLNSTCEVKLDVSNDFTVPITYSANDGTDGPFVIDGSVRVDANTKIFQGASASFSFLPNKTYTISGSYGGESDSKTVTTDGSGNPNQTNFTSDILDGACTTASF